jgi:predicted dehydrogenase
MVPVGIIGLSPAWEARYRPALKALGHRIAVRAVFDPVLSRAELAAAELNAVAVGGMLAIARRSDLKALLVFDTGWCGSEALRLLCLAGRPMFVGGALAADEASLDRLRETAAGCGTMVMPELGERYTPATCRLRELIATRLGRPLSIEIEAHAPAVPPGGQPLGRRPWEEFIARLADWCCYVVPTPPREVAASGNGSTGPETIRLSFAQPRSGGEVPRVEIRLRTAAATDADVSAGAVYRVRCERGEAEITSPSRIQWRTATERAEESLTSERSDVQLMLDHFCRRVVGGLIPVADLTDLRRSRTLAQAAVESRRAGAAIHLNGRA